MARPAIAAMLYFSLRMTIDAPWHLHWCDTGDAIHGFNGTVTFLAREAGLDMPFVREVNKVGNIVYFDPRYRLAIFPVGGQLHNFRTFANAGHRVVTPHAFADARHAGDRCSVGINMAVLARNLIVRGMYRMAERDRLNRAAIGEKLAVYPCACKQSEHKQ